ncbi:hypothetical protein [Flavitalea sp.]|nr:hypothetical protein [Flavitalea sp.]
MKSLENKVAVIYGAGGRLGRLLLPHLHAKVARLFLTGRGPLYAS